MLKFSHLIFFLFVICVCSCCSDKEGDGDPNNGYWPISQDVKDYTLFKPGTYWIYQDSASGAIDSVYVYDLKQGIDTMYDTHGKLFGYFDYFDEYWFHGIDGYTNHIWVNTFWTKQYGTTPVWKERFKPGDFVGQTFLTILPFDVNRQYAAYTDVGVITISGIYTSININGITYGNSVIVHNTENIAENRSPSNYYITKNIGLTRREIIDSLWVWNLIRYNIIQ